jgi:hypothetical protein
LLSSGQNLDAGAGDNDSIKANILDLVTLPARPAGLNFVRPPVFSDADPAISGPSSRDESSANAAKVARLHPTGMAVHAQAKPTRD